MKSAAEPSLAPGLAGRLANFFIDSKLTPLAVIASMLLGMFALIRLPREEEPQIKAPMIDVVMTLPGATPAEVENRLTRPVEKQLWEIPGVEYVYSTSNPGHAVIIVRFSVGTEIETALVRLNRQLQANADQIPPGVAQPFVKPRTIDDVPILALTLHSASRDHGTLRRLGAQLEAAVKSIPQVAQTTLIGGVRRAVRVQIDPAALSARGLTVAELTPVLTQANRQLQHGSRPFANHEIRLETGAFLGEAAEVGSVVVGTWGGRPVYLRDVATIKDTEEEPTDYVLHGGADGDLEAAVTLSIAKRPHANAVAVVEAVRAKLATLRGVLLPADVTVTLTRDYGHTAAEKSNELLLHMGIAVFGVAVLILLFLGWRESLIVLLAIPSTLALTLLLFYLYGYTLNRITLFALIFSIGILVDDAIVVVENIVRHRRQASADRKTLRQIALDAVAEVGQPTLLATWAVIAAILPMAFVGGLMGPYMRPIPVGATAAMLFSLLIAFTITPWAALHLLRRRAGAAHTEETTHTHEPTSSDGFTRLYHRVMEPLLDHRRWRWAFLVGIVGLLIASLGFVLTGAVTIKMLPFDNKSEFQIVLKTPEGTTLEQTLRIAQEMAQTIRTEPEVRDYQIYAGTAAPFNFNGLVRHYFMRSGPNVADIQVNLLERSQRSRSSHAIAKAVRTQVAPIAARYGAALAVAEIPPGPPVLASLVAEIYGPDESQRVALAREVKGIFARTRGVVDIDWYVEAAQPRIRYVVDKEKSALLGVNTGQVAQTLEFATQGASVDWLHRPGELEVVPLRLEAAPSTRAAPASLLNWEVRTAGESPARRVPLSELVRIESSIGEPALYRKNLQPVTYVTADVAGEVESPAYAQFAIDHEVSKIDLRRFGFADAELPRYHLNLPSDDTVPALKWDGEWQITLEVFRDLGAAFAVVLVLIGMLMVGWFRSYATPLVVMAAIPFSLIGILPAHWAMGAFFTATSMIGFMAGAGIVVRNSIILVDFIELRQLQGAPLREAVIEAGAVRFRPMLLTALAVVVGASVILADPIFQGLAISLMFGEVASLLVSRMAVPVLYYMAARHRLEKSR